MSRNAFGAGVHRRVLRLHHRHGDDRYAVALLERTAQLQAGAARDEELNDRDRRRSGCECFPGRAFGERHLDIKSLRLQEVLLEFRRVRVGLGEQDEELRRRVGPGGRQRGPGLGTLGQQTMCVGRAGAVAHIGPDELQLLNLQPGVQPLAAGAAARHHLPVPVLPRAQRRHGTSSIRATALML